VQQYETPHPAKNKRLDCKNRQGEQIGLFHRNSVSLFHMVRNHLRKTPENTGKIREWVPSALAFATLSGWYQRNLMGRKRRLPGRQVPAPQVPSRPALPLDDRLGEISGPIHVHVAFDGHEVGEELQRVNLGDGQ
jgi:hypothetical protein